MSQPIRIVTTKPVGTYPKGAEFEFASVADADKILGEGAYKITAWADGTAYQAIKATEKAQDADKEAKA